MESLAAMYKAYGPAADVIELEKTHIAAPKTGEALVRMEMAVINPSDLGTIAGTYGAARNPPHAAGWEGCGIVEEVGEDSPLKKGMRVAITNGSPTWSQYVIAAKDGCIEVPSGVPLEQAASAVVNPMTALRLLEDSVQWKDGDWAIQNAGNSAVSICFTQLAKKRGIKTISIVRRMELESFLKDQGATVVLPEGTKLWEEIKSITGGARVPLALNSVGGSSALALARSLSIDGVHVTYGGASSEAIRFPTRELIFQGLCMRGFWRNRWQKDSAPKTIQSEYAKIMEGLKEGWLASPVDCVMPLSQIKEALFKAQSSQRMGKVLIDLR